MVDPKNPGAVDEILNFGAFWNDEGIRVHKAEILETNKKISAIFARAYQYIKAAHALYDDSATIYQKALKKETLNQFIKLFLVEVLGEGEVATKEGNLRRLFASAMSPKGLIHYLDSIITVDQVYEIQGGLGTGEEKILEKVKENALLRGYNVEGYYCALNPQKLEHLVIPDLNLAITTSNAYHASSVGKIRTISMEQFYDMEILRSHQEDLAQDKMEFNALLGIGLQTISRAKALHDHLETYYVPNIDFEKINAYFDEIIAKIMKE